MPNPIMHRDGTKFCRMCNQWVALTLFGVDRRQWDGFRFYCRTCSNVKARASRLRVQTSGSPEVQARRREQKRLAFQAAYARIKSDPIARSSRHRKYKYGLSPADYARMLADQGGTCAICRNPPRLTRGLDVDHDHAAGQVRGLLCHSCNLALGIFKDDPNLVRAALSYLIS